MKHFHYILQNHYSNWQEIERLIEGIVSTQEKGDVFEQFVYAYLIINSDYYQIKEVYMSKDIPTEIRAKLVLETTDYGVDGVFVLMDGTIAAYQAKFRHARGTATVRELATFWSEASRADLKYIIANATELPKQAVKHSLSILADRFDELDKDFFDALYMFTSQQKVKASPIASPDAHQTRMINKVVEGFKNVDRGKLIAACGVGKTLTSLWIIESMNAKKVLILVPSLALIKQTLEAWSKHKKNYFSYLCICSDSSVIDAKELDYGEYETSEVDFPVTTDPEKIKLFLNNEKSERKYIFSTYNSARSIVGLTDNNSLDLIIFDEAHRTAGQKDSNLYSVALYDENIISKKRLFMTATERLVQPWIINKAAEEDRVIFSMDDKKIYGELFDRYTFGEAIKDGVISDYRILLTAVTANEIESLIKENRLIIAEGDSSERHLTAQNIYKQAVLSKAMQKFSIKKAITFHSNIKRAKGFINGNNDEAYGLMDLYKIIWPEIIGSNIYFDWVDGTMHAGLRKQKLRDFANSDLGIMSNAKCLTEGIDVPVIDGIYFVDPKTSLIDIVQACGRALRKSRNTNVEKIAYFVVPIIISEKDDMAQLDTGKFETLLNLVQALRNQDERMADWIDKINLGFVKGEGPRPDEGDRPDPILIDFPKEFDLSLFSNQIEVRIYEGIKGPFKLSTDLAYKVRRSNYRKVFKALGDYSFETYMNNLVDPTIAKFSTIEQEVRSDNLVVNNNNISHTRRLGLIVESQNKIYQLTDSGKAYFQKETDAKDIFKKAMLAYNCKNDGSELYPYRSALSILSNVGSVNRAEFLYGIYALQDSSSDSVDNAISRILSIRQQYPNILRVNDANKSVVLSELNERFDENFSEADLWASTTATNKFIYFKNHLSLFDGVNSSKTGITLAPEKTVEIIDLVESAQYNL